MKAVICDICGKVIRPYRKLGHEYIDYNTIQLGSDCEPYEACTECCDEVRQFVKTLQAKYPFVEILQKKGE